MTIASAGGRMVPGERTAGAAWLATGAMALATAVGAQVAVPLPFTPVPLTLQVFAVLLTGLVLPPRRALAAQAIYVGGGVAGLPWLAGMSSMALAVPGPTAGYLAGFVLAAPLVAVLRHRWPPVVAALAGVVAIHVAGCLGLSLLLGLPVGRSMWLGSVPFLPADVAKAFAAVAAARLAFPAR